MKFTILAYFEVHKKIDTERINIFFPYISKTRAILNCNDISCNKILLTVQLIYYSHST